MLFPPQGCQFHLFLSLAETLFLIRAEAVETVRTSHSPLVEFGLFFLMCYRMAAAIALIILTFFQRMINGNPIIKDKTLTFPCALLRRHLLKVFQDATLQVIDLFEALFQHKGRCLFTTYPAGAEHCDLFMHQGIQMLTDVGWKLSKIYRPGIYRTTKRTNITLVVIPGIEQ